MKLTEQIKYNWPFLIAVVIYVVLVVISTSGIGTVSDFIFGIMYILLAVTITYISFKRGKKIQEKGKYWTSVVMVYGSGLLSGSWLIQAINYLF